MNLAIRSGHVFLSKVFGFYVYTWVSLTKNTFWVIIWAIVILQWSNKMNDVNCSDTVTPVTKNHRCHENTHAIAVTKYHYCHHPVTAVMKPREDKTWNHIFSNTKLQNLSAYIHFTYLSGWYNLSHICGSPTSIQRIRYYVIQNSWWRHQMETFSA